MPSCRLKLKAIPNAPCNKITGWLGDALKVKIHAPALDGRANDALLGFLAAELGVSRRAVSLIQGDKSPHKIILIEGLTPAEARTRLPAADT